MSASSALVTPALLAQSVDYGEADRVCTLLTRSGGKVSALARAARKSRRRFGGALSLFVVGQATLGRRRGQAQLLSLERFDSLEDLAPGISLDVIKVAHGSYMLELARELWPPSEHDAELFDVVVQGLRVLATSPPAPTLLRAYELRLLSVAGLIPALNHCAGCGQTLDARLKERMGFSVAQGGVICADCGPFGTPLAATDHRALASLAQSSFAAAAALDLERPQARALRDLMLMVVRHHLGKDLRSLKFIASLAGANAGGAGR